MRKFRGFTNVAPAPDNTSDCLYKEKLSWPANLALISSKIEVKQNCDVTKFIPRHFVCKLFGRRSKNRGN
jgi:hypothetical protein